MISYRKDCRLIKCTTVLHGGVCHRTSTPHKSENKVNKKKRRQVFYGDCLRHIGIPSGLYLPIHGLECQEYDAMPRGVKAKKIAVVKADINFCVSGISGVLRSVLYIGKRYSNIQVIARPSLH